MTTSPDVLIRIRAGETETWKDFRGWEEVQVSQSIDNFSTLRMSAPFEPQLDEFRTLFKPFSYQDIEVFIERSARREVMLTGQLIGPEPRATPKSKTVVVNGYALPASLADSTPPVSEFPVQFRNKTLLQIAETLARPFKIEVSMAGEGGAQFRRIRIKPTEKIAPFLAKLARARGLVMRDTVDGKLEFLESTKPGNPVADLEEGRAPTMVVSATFSPQNYYSEITGLRYRRSGKLGSKYTATNPQLQGRVRPLTFTVGDVNAGDLPGAVKSRIARMFGNMVAYVIEVSTWEDPQGDLWTPNTTVNLLAPGAYVYRKTELLVRDVVFEATASKALARLGVVLPGAFSGEVPSVMPWD